MNIITRLKSSLNKNLLFVLLLYPVIGFSVDMPLGIPAPSFGLDEVAPAAPAAWPGNEAAGYYYIDRTHPNATDSSNQYGYPDKPRATIPNYATFPAGTYIEVHGGPYEGNQLVMTFNCTQQDPCWFRGADSSSMPTIRYETIAKGSYVIFENLKYDTDGKGVGFRSHDTSSLHHAALRNSEFYGSGNATSQNHSAVSVMGNSSNRFTDIVIYNNHIHDLGNSSPDAPENDYHGIHPDLNADRVWVLFNHVHHMGGDSIQIGRAQTESASYSSHIYVGGNDFHDNHEDTIDIKKVNNVIISENKLHDLPKIGALVVIHDYPDNIWMINNHMYNATVAVASVSATNVWTIGNLITDINHNPSESFNPNSAYQHGAGVHYRSTNGGVINNTIVRTDFGIELAGGPGPYSIVGNIIADRAESSAWDIIASYSSITAVTELDYNIFTDSKINWADGTNTTLAEVQARYNKCTNCFSGPEHPKFISSANDNFDIGAGSSAIDSGTLHSCFNTYFTRYGEHIHFALDGSNRLTTGNGIDIGAYEYNNGSVSVSPPNPPSNLTSQ